MKHVIIEELIHEIKQCDRFIEDAKKKLEENYTYNFSWGYPEHLFKNIFLKNDFVKVQTAIDKNEDKANEILNNRIEKYTNDIMEGKFTGTSTNHLHNLGITYELECKCQLVTIYKSYLKDLKS